MLYSGSRPGTRQVCPYMCPALRTSNGGTPSWFDGDLAAAFGRVGLLLRMAALLLAGLWFCAQAPAQTCTGLCLQQQTCPGGGTTSVSGTVHAPNGVEPLPGAVVYIPNATVQPFTDGPACSAPISGSPLVMTSTGIDGKFTLTNVPVGNNIPIVIQIGKWRTQSVIPTVTACVNNPVSHSATGTNTDMPQAQTGNTSCPSCTHGDIPKIAVVTGSVSSMECTLLRMGVAQSEFANPGGTGRIQLFQGDLAGGGAVVNSNTPTESTLWSSQASVNAYDAVMLASQGGPENAASQDQQKLIGFANAGGRVLAEENAYPWMEAFTNAANWNPGQGSWGNYFADTTYNSNIDTAFPGGSQLAHWLNQPAVYGGTLGQIPLGVIRDDFTSVIAPSQRWLYTANDVAAGGPGPNIPVQFSFPAPVGSTGANQCGRVMFNDWEAEAQQNNNPLTGVPFPAECPASTRTPGEKLFEYTLFNVTGDPLAPTATVAVSNSPSTFVTGDGADVVTIAVTNAGPLPLDSTLTVTASLPTGLTAVSMAGTNPTTAWSCNSSTLECTRNAPLNFGASDPIALTVSVQNTAPLGTGAVTVSATAANGGLPGNVTGSDAVSIRGIPVITWSAPAAVTYGTALSSTQLDASCSVPGTLAYTPPLNTVLSAGTHTLSVTCTPTDSVDYAQATATVQITVVAAPTATPVFLVTAGTYPSVQSVGISCATPSSRIYYTTDSSIPINNWTLYTAPITVAASETLQAYAAASGYNNSPTVSAAYTIVASPVALAAPASLIGTTTATLNALVNSNGVAGYFVFQVGATPASFSPLTPQTPLFRETAHVPLSASTAQVTASTAVTGLRPATVYYYRVVVSTVGGTSQGAVLSFTTH